MSYILILLSYVVGYGIGIYVVVKLYREYKNPAIILIGLFGVQLLPVLIWMLVNYFQVAALRDEFRGRIDELSKDHAQLMINGETVSYNDSLIVREFRWVKRFSAHHSSPQGRFETVIKGQSNQDSLKFYFCRDSQIKNEYWVYYNDIEIGRMNSDLLDYLSSESD